MTKIESLDEHHNWLALLVQIDNRSTIPGIHIVHVDLDLS